MTRVDWDRDRRRSQRAQARRRDPRPINGGAPTERQLRYLTYLAGKTGTDFAEPTSSAVASAEIHRLLRLL